MMKQIGQRIKKRREELGLLLWELATKVGVSSSALSQIENSKAYPTIITLKSIADNLYTSVSKLIGEHEAFTKNPLTHYTDKQYIKENDSGTTLYLLTEHFEQKQMDTLLLVFPGGADSETLLTTNTGQTYLFVVKGELEFVLEDEKHLLKKNDSMYFNTNRSNYAVNKSHREAHLLIVNTPPARN